MTRNAERGSDSWHPLPKIFYGFALHPFSPSTYADSGAAASSGRHAANRTAAGIEIDQAKAEQHMADLEVGDEIYAFERYEPRHGGERNVWLRGYVVSTARTPAMPALPSDPSSSSATASDVSTASEPAEPSIFLGVFPAAFVHVREELDDAEGRLGAMWREFEDLRRVDENRYGSGAGRGKAPLEALPEDEEDEDQLPSASAGSSGTAVRIDSAALSAPTRTPREKLPPPIPSLKAGDETAGGAREPLVDEIACALREWHFRLFGYLLRREYDFFARVNDDIVALHLARRQLIEQALGGEELASVRRGSVSRLVKGNVSQGLDVIVRHPDTGALVTVAEGDADLKEVDTKSFVSGVRMYAMQVASAYFNSPANGSVNRSALADLSESRYVTSSTRLYHRPTGSQSTVSLGRLSTARKGVSVPAVVEETAPGGDFHHLFLEVRAFAANPCVAGETAELAFSLYSVKTRQFISEEFLVVVDHHGTPAHDPLRRARTLFKDLGAQELGGVALVCKIVRVGSLKLAAASSTAVSASPSGSVRSSFIGSPDPKVAGLAASNGHQVLIQEQLAPFRRPFGCAVIDVTDIMSGEAGAASIYNKTRSLSLQIYIPNDESSFASLHEDIIEGRGEFFGRSPRANSVAIDVRAFFGRPLVLAKEHPALLDQCPPTDPLGFPDVVFPGQNRNDLYVKLWAGNFANAHSSGSGGARARKAAPGVGAQVSGGVFQVTVEVRRRQGGARIDQAISRGSHEPPVAEFHSLVFANSTRPTFGELVKVSNLDPSVLKDCHLFISYRQRHPLRECGVGTGAESLEQPFAFSYLPLSISGSGVFLPDGDHNLVVYRADRLNTITPAQYFALPAVLPAGAAADEIAIPVELDRLLAPTNDSLAIRTFLCSTSLTQSDVLVRLLEWESNGLSRDQVALAAVLRSFAFVSEVEICKVLKNVFDALFGLLVANTTDSPNVTVEALVFDALISVVGIVQDRRFTNFKPVLDIYIDQHFAFASVWRQLIRCMSRLLADKTSQQLRAAIKVWHYIFRFISRSRELQKEKDTSLGGTSERLAEHLQAAFKTGLDLLIRGFIDLMHLSEPSSIIGTQTIALQHFSDILPDLASTFDAVELSEIVISFSDAAPPGHGKAIVWKLLLHLQTARSVAFDDASARASLVPSLIRWVKPFLGRRPSELDLPTSGSDAALIVWIETLRLAVTVLAVMLDKLSEFVVLAAKQSRMAMLQEQENIDLIFSCLPKLLESYYELRSHPTLDAIDRHQVSATAVCTTPVVFPAISPSPLIAPPAQAPLNGIPVPMKALNNTLGEIAAVILVLLIVQPTDGIKAFLDEQLEVEGAANLNRTLLALFNAASSILRFEAFPRDWLNVSLLAHTAVLKCLRLLSSTMFASNFGDLTAQASVDSGLWNACLETHLQLLSSDQVVIESFGPQKRRAVWRLSGDIRGEGASSLKALWQAPGRAGSAEARGFHNALQSCFPGYVRQVLRLCLSHHDHLRAEAVDVLCSMIGSQWASQGHFDEVKSEMMDQLNTIFMHDGESNDLARVAFITTLRGMFTDPLVDPRLRQAIDDFLDSVDSFLDLLLGLRDLPAGEQYQDDRTVGTLRLLNLIRRIGGRNATFIQYVHQLVEAHVLNGDYTEAGLTLKMHAALYAWRTDLYVEPLVLGGLALPRQSQFDRKEALLLQTLDYLGRGKAFELAIETCKDLEYQHANVTFDYLRLAELLSHHSRLSESIMLEPRSITHYFLVAYFGGFPLVIRNRRFVYRGADGEKLGGFVDRLQAAHPAARLLMTNDVPEDVRCGSELCIQVLPVMPEPDRSKPVFRPEVPREIRSYYETSNVNHFSYSRPFSKSGASVDADEDPANAYLERTYYTTEESLPSLIRRSEVVATRTVEITGLENAIHDVQTKTQEFDVLESNFSQLADSGEEVDTNPLSMALNAAVDSPQQGGVPDYRRAFLAPNYLEAHPGDTDLVEELRISIDLHVLAIHRCLVIHAALCPESLWPFHITIQQFFSRNFAPEIERLHLAEAELRRPSTVARSLSMAQPSQLPQSRSMRRANGFIAPSRRSSIDDARKQSVSANSRGSIHLDRGASLADENSYPPTYRDSRSTAEEVQPTTGYDTRSDSRFSAYLASPGDARSTPTPLPADRPLHYSPVARVEPRPLGARAASTSSSSVAAAVSPKQRSDSRLSRLSSVLRKKTAA